MSINQINIASIILSAGKSERMGQHKALLKWNNKISFLEKIYTEYKNFGCQKIILIVNEDLNETLLHLNFDFLKNIKIICNTHPEFERFYSIKLGAKELNPDEACFIQNIDNPFLNQELLFEMKARLSENAYCVPYFKEKGGHPILLSSNIIQKISHTPENNLNFKQVLNGFNKISVNTNIEAISLNINSPEIYQQSLKFRNINDKT
jgi:CTP:molybdopterin cytidylyltransferase MocA